MTEKISEFFGSETGKSILMIIISQLLPKFLKLQTFKKFFTDSQLKVVESISDEFRIQAETDIALVIFNKFESLISSITQQFTSVTNKSLFLRIDVQSETIGSNELHNEIEMEAMKLASGFSK